MRDELSEERTSEERSANSRDVVRTKGVHQRVDQRRDSARLGKQWIKIEPEPAMIAGREPEKAATAGN